MAKQQQRRKTTSRTKTTRRKSSSKRKQNTDLFTQFGQFLGRIIRDDRTTKVFGLIFWFFAIVLGLAFISYIFTGEADQSYVHQSGASLLLEGDIQTQNWLGRFGTVTSHFFFYKLFGLASFAIIFLLSAIGSKLLVRDLEISLGEVTRETFLFIIVCSAILGFLSSGDASGFPYGGALGTYIYNQVYALLGFIGTALLLLLGLAITLVLIFDVQFEEETISKSSF
ncbi:MAG: DNA translocase FtsK 4TM domain-containing protein, partial [Chitinophagales bacterium]